MATRWKVTRRNRESWSAHLRCDEDLTPLLKVYKVGATVVAHPSSIGIICFKTEKQALAFINLFAVEDRMEAEILKVKGIGRGRIPLTIPSLSNTPDLPTLFSHSKVSFTDPVTDHGTWIVPPGTICYKSIKVLT